MTFSISTWFDIDYKKVIFFMFLKKKFGPHTHISKNVCVWTKILKIDFDKFYRFYFIKILNFLKFYRFKFTTFMKNINIKLIFLSYFSYLIN